MKKVIKFIACVAFVGSFFLNGVHASYVTAYLYADDSFVNTSTVATVGSSDSARATCYNGETYSTSKKNASFGVYYLTRSGNWELGDGYITKAPGESFGNTASYGNGNYAYLKIVAGNDMVGVWNKNAIARGSLSGN